MKMISLKLVTAALVACAARTRRRSLYLQQRERVLIRRKVHRACKQNFCAAHERHSRHAGLLKGRLKPFSETQETEED
jgi:hypothetical protein